MNVNQLQTEVVQYGIHADYSSLPDESTQEAGVKPLDTLPAQWWNALWLEITKGNNNCVLDVANIRAELKAVLTAAGMSADGSSTNQLRDAIQKLAAKIASTDTPGGIISSDDIKSVSVSNLTGQAVVNGLVDWDTTATVKQRIDGVGNDLAVSVSAEKVLTITINGHSATVDLSPIIPTGAERATYARYLVPTDTSTSTAIRASADGTISATALELR